MKITLETKLLSVNRCWQGRRFKTPDYVSYEREILYMLPKPETTIKGNVRVQFSFFLKNNKKSDVDNLIKPLLDILTKKGYFEDDRQITELLAYKFREKNDRVNIEITEL